MNVAGSGAQPLLPTIENIPAQSCANAQSIARARAQLASRMMRNQYTSTQSQDAEMVRPDDVNNPTDNSLGMEESQQSIGNANPIFAPENWETQLPDHSREFQGRNEDGLFCSPGPDENIEQPSCSYEPLSPLALTGEQTIEEQGEQNNMEPSFCRIDDAVVTPQNRKRASPHLLSPFEMEEMANKPETKKRNSNRNQKGNGQKAKRKPKAAPKRWQKNGPTLSGLSSSNGIQHAKTNAGKLEIPSSSSKNKETALKEIVANVPAENLKEAISDRRLIMEASLRFKKKPKMDGEGGWLHPNMNTSLFHYQLLGAAFMRHREKSETLPFGGFLCDEMGFGKTIQAIANIIDDQETDNVTDNVTLIVAPSHLTKHWLDQFIQHGKKGVLRTIVEYHARSKPSATDIVEFFSSCSVIITTYTEVRMSIPKFKPPAGIILESEKEKLQMRFVEENRGPLHRMNFRRIILDEAHEIKNNDSQTSVAVRMLSGHFRWVVTGTPLHNGTHELYPYLDFLQVPVGCNYKKFLKERLENYGTEDPWINSLLRTCMLKRGHDETLFGYPILKLPGVEERDIVVKFSAAEKELYQKVIVMFLEEHDVFSKPAGKPKKEYQNKFTMLLRLRMFTSHLLLAQMVLKDFLTISEVQSLRLSISERSEPMDVQICSLLEDLIREQTLQENELEKSSSAPKTQLPKLQISNLQKLINDFVDDLKSPSEEPDKTKCIKCHRSPTSVHLTSCRHIYCQDCAGEAMIRIGSVCDCGAPVEQTVYWDSLESLIASATLRSEGNPIAMMNPRKKSRRKVTRKGSNVEVEGQKETGINWVDYAGHLMPGAKLIAISSCLEGWFKRSSQTKVVIFTQFLEMAHILNSMCQKKDWGCLLHTGKTPIRIREQSIRAFSEDPTIRIFICSHRTGGTGLDLTAANKCLLVDLWWNEAIEQQAFFRLFRINQKRNVEFVRVVIKNSIDDRLQMIQNDKTEIIDKVMGSEVLTSRDSLANFCTILGVEQDDSTETGYRFISDEEAERRHETGRVTVLDNESGEASGHAEAAGCARVTSDTDGSAESHLSHPVAGDVEGTEDFFEFPKGFEDAKLAKARGGTVVPGISEAEGTGQATNEACYEIPMECEEAIGDS
ncbi:hypothetical protein GX50_05300 [[Emmonsia] crescens]|uniref:DNA repair protein RAD5 n=1 Tax=[Emmonsia] crescens TaxID=73230 RepID=A0A2B7ZGH8_9EURO|nr:hypothetical protein GX50_05300 [Emmonsia crescens]